MKLFQQLLVAPAALGLMAPMAVTAAELNMNGVSDYSASSVEVQNFSDVHPSDWAFKALTDLADRHGCAVATPNGSMSRYEAAALLNKCLGNVAQVNEEERLLLNEFGPEIAVLKGRVDGLEARIGEFEAGQFSSTTTMTGKAIFSVGSVDSDETDNNLNTAGELHMNYVYQLNMNTSFTGEDLLYARIKTGNFGSHFEDSDQGTHLAVANPNADVLEIDKIWYQFPVGDSLQFWVGPKIENYYMLASAPSIYRPILKGFKLGGNGTTYGSSTQAGMGAAWTQQKDDPSEARFAVSVAYTNDGGEEAEEDHGLFGDGDESAFLVKTEYGSNKWQASIAMASKGGGWQDGDYTTHAAHSIDDAADQTSWALRGWWKPDETGSLPNITVGTDFSNFDDQTTVGNATETFGWFVGLGFEDLFVDGNRAGVAFGQRQHATEIVGGGDDPAEDTFSWEAYYTFQITDGVSITPTLFGNQEPDEDGTDNTGMVVLTTFKF